MKKKIKDLTLEEVGKICDEIYERDKLIYERPTCYDCPFHKLKYGDEIYKNGERIVNPYCPYETTISMIGDLANEEIEVDLDE